MTTIKKSILFTLVGLFLILGLFYQTAFSFVVEKMIQGYVKSQFGCGLHYDQFTMQDRTLIFEAPDLHCDHGFKAVKMTLKWDLDLKRRQINLHLNLIHPIWKLEQTPEISRNGLKKVFKEKKGKFKFSWTVQIDQGLLLWKDNKQALEHSLHFDLTSSPQSGAQIEAYFGEKKQDDYQFLVTSAITDHSLTLHANCHRLNCPEVWSLTQLVLPEFHPVEIRSGEMSGTLSTVFPIGSRPYLEGFLSISGLSLGYHNQGQLTMAKSALIFQKNPKDDSSLTTIAKLSIDEPADVLLDNGKGLEWSMQKILGEIAIDGSKTGIIRLSGIGQCKEKQTEWKLGGIVNLDAHHEINLNIDLETIAETGEKGGLLLGIHQINEKKAGQFVLKNMNARDLSYLQDLFTIYIPKAQKIAFQQGTFDGSLELILGDLGIERIDISHFHAIDGDFKIDSHHSSGGFDDMELSGNIQFNEADPWDSLQGTFKLVNGRLALQGTHELFPITDIQANLEIDKGLINHSLMTLNWMGLKGKMDLEWGEEKKLLLFDLDGYVHDIADLFPVNIQTALNSEFKNSRLKILANVKKTHQIELNGTVHVQQNQSNLFDLIHFGCHFNRTQKDHQIKWIPTGHFYAHRLPLEKFLSPFIFRKGILKMSGEGEFKGAFDQNQLTVHYNAQNLKIENDKLLIEVKKLRAENPGKFAGVHQFDFTSLSHHGHLPVKKLFYLEKNTGLLFNDIHGTFLFRDKTLSFQEMEGFCKGANFAGSLALDYSDPAPGVFSLLIDLPEVWGKISQIQTILSHLKKKTVFNQIPLEGDLCTRNQGLHFVFNFGPDEYDLTGNIQASMIDSSLPLNDADMSLKGLFMDIDYHHEQQELNLSDIQGTLLVGKPARVEEYLFGGNHITIKDIEHQDIDLDVWIKDHSNELMRIKGKTLEISEGTKSLTLDPISHLSAIHPDQFTCHIKDWQEIHNFSVHSIFKLQDFVNDLLLFRQTGLYFFNHTILDKLSQVETIKGEMELKVSQLSPEHDPQFSLSGENLSGLFQNEHYFSLIGHKGDKKWFIDDLKINDMTIHAEILPIDGSIQIPFLGIKAGQSLLAGLEGEIIPQEGKAGAKINLFDINLDQLDHWPSLKEMVQNWHPKGHLKGTGHLAVDALSTAPWYQLRLALDAELHQFDCKGCPLFSTQPFRINYQNNGELQIEKAVLQLPHSHTQAPQVTIDKLCYDANTHALTCSEMEFSVPTHHLEKVSDTLQTLFPSLINDKLKSTLSDIKSDGVLKGSLGFDQSENREIFYLKLDEGLYKFNESNFQFKDFNFNIDDSTLLFSALSEEEGCPYRIEATCQWPDLINGVALLTDLLPNHTTNNPPLKVNWSWDSSAGLNIYALHGNFCGLNFNLSSMSDYQSYQGSVSIDFNQMKMLLNQELRQEITDLELGSNYTFQGDWTINFNQSDFLLNRLTFNGTLHSQEAIIKNTLFQSLVADLNYTPGLLTVSNLSIDDPAFHLKSDQISVQKSHETDSWWFSTPLAVVKDLSPTNLRDAPESDKGSTQSTKYKNLLIKRIDFHNFYGDLSNVRTWQTEGSLQFVNPTRKNAPHPLFAIPAEIVLRLGLNPQVLNPVTGTIFFELRGDRFYLNRFKDVYSEGRGSRFYLAEGPSESWMDLHGNLSVQVRMKQYNLLFKLAELFTVSIEGNIKKPQFYLQKSPKSVRKGKQTPFDFDDVE